MPEQGSAPNREPNMPEPAKNSRPRKWSREQISTADANITRAFELLGLVGENGPICPICGTGKRGKVQIKTSASSGRPYWTCHRCIDPGEGKSPRPWGGSAIDLLREHGGRDFNAAMQELSGGESSGGAVNAPRLEVAAAFRAVVDVQVYDRIRDAGSLSRACEYYAQWHISADAVEKVGCRYLEDAETLQQQLVEEFGHERLTQAGVTTVDGRGRTLFLFSDDYPVVEPHTAPSGHVVGMQFRPSPKRLKDVNAHKEWKKRWSGQKGADGEEIDPTDAWRAAYTADRSVGRRSPYVTPFLSLRGGGPDHLVGGGLHLLHEAPDGTTVYVVEGLKDLMAAITMGVHAYAIPGASTMPPEHALSVLRRHRLKISLDGDAAGEAGRDSLARTLQEKGLDAEPVNALREGMDITDVLVERHAHGGCDCDVCTRWRQQHAWDREVCACRTCRKARERAG